ncbi:MAG: hypothetical protein LUD22_00265 [Coprobacillus sp.]|nr:hypothetical protein [Coprobacillus sp.]
MQIVESYGKNIFYKDKMVGYISRDGLYVLGKKFADITDEGVISMNGKEVGEVNEDRAIIINGKDCGFIDGDNNFVLDIEGFSFR